jgi:hypothetical protein
MKDVKWMEIVQDEAKYIWVPKQGTDHLNSHNYARNMSCNSVSYAVHSNSAVELTH